ncbi:hypothetical protein [Aliiroseovarius crassostreae]|uniref:hypothetical protein n=1 Tax=Aliiroseovarius crassostreae TaxID=154981 RepID=UPI003C79819B
MGVLGKTLSCAAVLLTMSLGQANAKNYYCVINKSRGGGDTSSLPPDLYVWHDETTGSVKVLDGMIQKVFEEPIGGAVSVDNTKRMTFSYTIKKVPGKNQYGGKVLASGLGYRLTIQKSDLSATLSMKPLGFANTFRGEGKCSLK